MSRYPPMPSGDPIIDAVALLGAGVEAIHRHLHELKENIVSSKQEVLAELGEVKTILVEAGKDVNRVADKLDAAVAAGNLDEVSAAVDELRTLATSVGERAEAADPEPVVEEPSPEEPINP